MTVSPSAVRIKKASGWQDMAIVGPPGPPGAMTLIGKYDLAALAGVISGIPQTYDHLRLVVRARSTAAGALPAVFMNMNGVVAAGNYDYNLISGYNSAVSCAVSVGGSSIYVGNAPGNNTVAGFYGEMDLLLPRYTVADKQHVTGTAYCFGPISLLPNEMQTLTVGGDFRPLQAITSITLTTTTAFAAGSTAWLYGIGPNASGAASPTLFLPRCLLRNTGSNVQMTANAWNVLSWGTEQYDTDNMHDAVNPTRITFRTAGYYRVTGNGYTFSGGTSNKSWRIQRSNGVTLAQTSVTNIAQDNAMSLSAEDYFAVGDYVTFEHHPGTVGDNYTLGSLVNFSATMTEGMQGPPGPSTAIPLVSTLPATPVDGQEVYYLADATNGVIWHLRYRASDPSAYKWNYVGGPPLTANVDTNQAISTTGAWTDVATVGPSVTIPLAGSYVVGYGAMMVPSAVSFYQAGVANGATAPGYPIRFDNLGGASNVGTLYSVDPPRVFTAGQEARLRYYAGAAGCSVQIRRLHITPVRVG